MRDAARRARARAPDKAHGRVDLRREHPAVADRGGAGLGLVFPTASNTATARIDPAESGVASSLVNVGQQVGGSVGTALLNTIAVSATTAYVSSHRGAGDVVARGTVHGYTVAFWWSAGIFAFGALVCGYLLPGRPQPAPAEPVPVAA